MIGFFKHRRLISWRELKELAGNVASSETMRKAEDFLVGMIAVIFICMTALFFYFFLVVIAL